MRFSFKNLAVASLLCSSAASSVYAVNAPQKSVRAANVPWEPLFQEPSVSTLTLLLGRKIDDETVQNFVKEQHLQKTAKFDSGSYTRHNDSTETFALVFSNNVIDRVIIHVVPAKGVASAYRGTLPFGAKATDSPAIIRKRFGKARYDIVGKYDHKPGDGWLVYNKGAVAVTFAFEHNKMYEIYLDPPGKFSTK